MAKIFRKQRWDFIDRKRLGKYLIYASGEIILVVIGILIALAINNANQNSKLREKENAYLNGLANEFQTSKRKLQELIRVNQANMDGARLLLTMELKEDTQEKELSELLYSTVANDISFNPNNALLTEMINSGSLKDLKNDTLRLQLTTWMSSLVDIASQENDLRLEREGILEMFRTDAYSLRAILDDNGITQSALGLQPDTDTISNLEIIDSRSFKNKLLFFLLTSHQTDAAHYQPLLQDLNQILALIETELESN